MKKFIVLCLAGLCLPLILFPQNHGKPLYPVILIHGWAGDETSWTHDNGDWTDYFKKLGWTDGGRLDFTLEAISLTPHDPAAADVVYMGPAQVPDSDFYEINFNINRHGDLHPSVAYYVQNILSYHQKFSLSINSNNFIEKQGNPANIHLNDIIAAGNELMRVTGIEGPNGPFDVQRGYGGTPVSNHVGNFKVIDISNLSNQASGVKQGIALKMAIQKVKAATGASKVILIGHSMGGAITARAYVQSEDYQHDVAKIITISSPHMGSNASDVNVFSIGSYKDYDLRSDAVRDLRYNRFPGLPVYPLPPPYPSANDNAPYLFGGPENSPWFENWLLGDLKFYSMDVDGDGIESSSNFIQGLNSKPWPEDVFLHCVITQRIQNGLIPTLDDDIVNCNRQYPAPGIVPSALLDTSRLNVSMATPFPIAILHTQAQDHIYQIMRGFDEPDQRQYAWEVPVNQAPDSYISGFTTRQTFNAASDEDWFKFTADRTGTARVQISEIHNEAIWHLAIFKNSDTSPVITQNQSTKPGNLAEVFFDVEEGETIYIRFVSEALPDSYQKPYLLKVNTGQGVSTVNVTASQYANVDVFSMVSITVHALDYAGDPVPGARLTLSTNNDGYFSNLPFNEITTDDQGMAMVSYVPRVTGSHLITATSVTGIEGNLPSPIQVITTNTPGNKIVQWEYWFDGNYSDRLLMGCYPSKILELSASIGINLLPEGLHTLNIRFRDKLGKWSYTTNDVFIKTSLEQVNTITSYQYWFDDPDQGITDNLITPGNQVNLIKNVNLLKLDAGLHSFNIRFRDKGGDYSNPVTQYFYYTGNQYPVDKITSYEYWFDDQITGREIVGIAETPNLNLVTGIPVNSLDAGLHVFNLRFKDRSGMYSSVSKTYFYKADEAGITQNKIKSYRYYFDNNNQDMTQVAEASAVSPLLLLKQVPVRVTSAGNHSFHIQFQDQNEKWSCLYTYSFTVTSQLSANFSADHVSVCTGSPVSFQNLSPGFVTSWQWEFTGGTPTTSGLPDPAVVYNAPGTYTVRLIVSNGTNHDTVTKTQYISVIQSPTVSWSTSVPTLCDNTTSYSLSGGTPAGGSYSGPGVTGTNLNPSLAGTGNQQILYRYTSSNGCTSSVAKTVQIAPTPVVTWESVFPPVCSTTDPYPLTGALPEGGIYTGTGVIGGIIHPLIAGSGNQTLVYTYTSESGCTNSQTNPLTILSPPVVSATIIQDIEPGTQAGLSASGNNGSGSYLFSWTPGSLLNHAYWQNPTTVSLAQTTLFSVRVTDLSTYCASTPVNSLVRVTGTSPAVDLIADKDSTNPGDEILLTAFANTGNGQIEYRWYENSAYLATTTDPFITVSPAVTTNYQVIVHVTFEVVTNEGTSYFSEEGSDSVHITVNAVSTVTFTGNFPPVCPSSPVVPLTTGSPTGGTYSGTGVSGNGSTGFSFNPVGLIAGLYTITYSLMVNGETASATNQIEVKYAPVVTWPGPLPSVCHGSTPEILSGATPTGGVYRVNGLISGNFDPSMYPPGLVNLSYTYTDPFTGCSASGTNSITVFSLPPVTWDGFLYTMCENSASLDLTTAGVSPLGGIFSGNGVSGASFNPTNAGVGTHLITYTLIDINTGCTNSISRNITVDAIPNVTFAGNLPSVCPSSPNVVLNTGLPAGGYYSGTGVVGSGFDPAGLVQGIYTITYTYYTVNGCSAFATNNIEVKSAPVVTWPGPLPPVCQGSAPVILSGATPTGGVYRVNGLISGNFDPSMYPPGLVNLSYTYTDPITECSAYATNSVSVISGPTIFNVTGGGSYAPGDPGVIVGLDGSQVDVVYQLHINGIQTGISLWGSGTSISFGYQVIPGIYTVIATNAITNCISVMANSAVVTQGTSVAWPNPLPNLCRNAGSYILTGGLPEGGTYSGTGVENGVFNPELCPEFYTWYETYTLTYSYSDNEGNTSSATNTITLYQVPVVTWNSPLMSVCINASPIWLIGGTPAGGVYSGPGVFGCIFDASIAGIGMHSLTYTYTDYTSGCSGIVTRTITVTPLPENVTAGPDITINSGSSTTLNGTASPEGGPYSYSWEPTTGLSDPNIPNPVASPSETTTYTLVVTNMNGCSASDQVTVTVGNGYSINGQVLYAKPPPELLPIENMLLHLANGNGTVIQSVTTDAEGNYQFTDVPEGIYTILPGNNLPWSNVVVNSIDLLLYQRVILGLTSLGDFYLQAGKVDNENAVNSYDLYLIQTRILGLIDSFTTGDWLFEDASLTVSGGNQVKNLNALMYGDANASYYPTTGTPCPGIPSFSYGGQTYNTVQIGNQCWMKENLNIGSMIPGDSFQTNNSIIEKYCYDNNPDNCIVYGGLYQWPEMMQYITTPSSKGICANGWHLPSNEEWDNLACYLGGLSIAGGKMKQVGNTYWSSPNISATNESGFTGLGAGWCWPISGYFSGWHYDGIFWSSSEFFSSNGYNVYLISNSSEFPFSNYHKEIGYSVRCLKDICSQSPTQSNAGPDQTVTGTSTTLAANTPQYGTGSWGIVSGNGGVVAETGNPLSGFTGLADSIYLLTWTISTACASSVDTVVITFNNLIMNIPCPGLPSFVYEGRTYNTVQIGNQCWMRENLNVGTMVPSTNTGSFHSDCNNNGIIEKYCYNNDPVYCNIYGGLYDWNEMMLYSSIPGKKGICPTGWHIPTDEDVCILTTYLDPTVVCNNDGSESGITIGAKLKETGTNHWAQTNSGVTNESGFTALGAGYRDQQGYMSCLSVNEMFWTSSTIEWYSEYLPVRWYLFYQHNGIDRGLELGPTGYSVRCLKDTCSQSPTQSDAGPNQTVTGTSTNLAANVPQYGTGSWSIVTGNGGVVAEPGNPLSGFTGLTDSTYLLTWTISNACASSVDSLSITFSAPVFTCGSAFTDTRDGYVYNTVQIGEQCWMKQNLNVGLMIAGSAYQTNNGTIERYCYDNNPLNCDTYGALYQWDEMMNYAPSGVRIQGICPFDWHIPSVDEWTTLSTTLGGDAIAGGKMKETGLLHWDSPNSGANNESGFSGLGAGCLYGTSYNSLKNYGIFWTSYSHPVNGQPYFCFLGYYDPNFIIALNGGAHYGYSVRCIKNCVFPLPSQSYAGSDQTLSVTTTTLAGNTPLSGTGTWSLISGSGGTIAEVGNPVSVFTGIAGNTYTLIWTINTACASSIDTVVLIFNNTIMNIPCPDLPSFVYGGQTYNTVQIGNQCWMRENLNIGIMISGSSNQTNNNTLEKYCYNNDPANCSVYGGFYQWDEIMQYNFISGTQGICPSGWHIPTDNEWCAMTSLLDTSVDCINFGWSGLDIGDKLKETSSNQSGFTAVGAGYRAGNGGFTDVSNSARFWTSTEYSSLNAVMRYLYHLNPSIGMFNTSKLNGYSVRCIKNP